VTLTEVTVQEGTFTGTGPVPTPACPETALAPGAQMTCTSDYALSQDDIDNGSISNVAHATGETPDGVEVVAEASSVTLPEAQNPVLTLVKSVTPTRVVAAGDRVTYTFVVTNAGNVTLRDMQVVEGDFTGTGSAPPAPDCPDAAATMLPGAQVTCTATYTITQDDIDAGHVTNKATAKAVAPSDADVVSPPSAATVVAPAAGVIKVVKSAAPAESSAYTAGQTITYSYVVTNTGNVTLNDVKVDETTFTGSGAAPVPNCPVSKLGPGAQTACSATYVLTQADIDRGSVTNVATATGRPPSGPQAVAEASSVTIPQVPQPAINVVKTADPTSVSRAGEQVTYTFRVTNTGNVTVRDMEVDEVAFSGTGPKPVASCPAGAESMLPGIEVTCQATYAATAVDAAAGTVTNTASASGTTPRSGTSLVAEPSSALVRVAAVTDTQPLTPAPRDTLPRTGPGRFQQAVTVGAGCLFLGTGMIILGRRRRHPQTA
jgi:uncharacterized repeat protein (TIGR01451 family)